MIKGNQKAPQINPYLLILIAPVLLLTPLLITGKAMYWGTPALQFVPWRHFAWEMIRSGNMPLWNSLVGMGAPLLANYQSALLYPPNWLLFLLDEVGGIGWAAWGQGVLVTLHLVWAGLGMYFLGARLGLGKLAKTICGLAFGLSGYLVARSGFLSINSAVAWLPWVLLYSVSYGRERNLFDRQSLKLAIAVAFQLLAGHAQTAWYTFLLAFIWSGVWNWHAAHSQFCVSGINPDDKQGRHPHPVAFRRIGRDWGRFVLVFGFGVLLAAIQLIPTGEYLLQSQRSSSVEYDFAMAYSFWPWRLLTLVAPGMFGSPVSGDYWGYGNYWEDALYIGLLPLLLGIAAMLRAVFRVDKSRIEHPGNGDEQIFRHKIVRFLVVLIILSFLLALGNRTPIYPWLYKHVPTMAMFQAPTRFSIWAVFALSLLAGIGVEAWRRPVGRGLYWSRLGIAGALAISIGAGLTWYFLGEVSPTFIRSTALTGLFGVLTGLLTLSAPSDDLENAPRFNVRRSVWEWSVATFVMIDLVIAHWGLIPGIDQNFYTMKGERINPEIPMLKGSRLYIQESDEYTLKFERFFRFDAFEYSEEWSHLRGILLPNLGMLDGVMSANNFDPLLPGRYDRWIEAVNASSRDHDQSKFNYLLNLMNVGVVESMDNSTPLGVEFLQRQVLPRLRWVPCSLPASNDEVAWHLVFNQQVDHNNEVVIEDDSAFTNHNCSASSTMQSKVEIVSDSPNHLTIITDTDVEGWLVLSDVWYPGWRAFVDNDMVPVFRANYLFKAIQLPAGAHWVSFSYDPPSFRTGAWISVIAWAFLGAGWFFLRPRDA